jgi:hypothetical protein
MKVHSAINITMDEKIVEKIDRLNDDLWKLSKDIDNSGLVLAQGSRSVVQAINKLSSVADCIKKSKRRELRKNSEPTGCKKINFHVAADGLSDCHAKKKVVFADKEQELADECLEKQYNKLKRNMFLSCEPSSSKERLSASKNNKEAAKKMKQFCLDGNKIGVKKPEGSGNGSGLFRKGSSKIFFLDRS